MLPACGETELNQDRKTAIGSQNNSSNPIDTGLSLPWDKNDGTWMTNGPHSPWGDNRVYSSIDFRKIDVHYGNILAMGDGNLRWEDNFCNGSIVIDHPNGFSTRYMHLKYGTRRAPGAVKRGDVIAQYGRPQIDAACFAVPYGYGHLHLDLFYNGQLVDISDYAIGGWQFRRNGTAYSGCIRNLGNDSLARGWETCQSNSTMMSIVNEGKIGPGDTQLCNSQSLNSKGHSWTPSGGWTGLWGDDDNNGFFVRDTFESDRNTYMQYWWKDGSDGGSGNSWFTYANAVGFRNQNYAYWRFTPPQDGYYDVYVYVPNTNGSSGLGGFPTSRAPNVKYRLNVAGGAELWNTRVDQGAQGGSWVRLSADNRLNPSTAYTLLVADGDTDSSNRRIYWDSAAIKLTRIIDTQPPSLAITSPANNTSVTTAALTITGTTSDNVGVTSLRYQLNSGALQTINNNGGTFSFNVTLVAGSNTIAMSAMDAAGNVRNTSVTVNYQTSPNWTVSTPNLTLPAGVVGGSTTFATFTIGNNGTNSGSPSISSNNLNVIGFGMVDANPIAVGSSKIVTVTAVACTSVGTQTATLTISGGGSPTSPTVNVSRTCTAAIQPPSTPTSLNLTMSSSGRILAAWQESSNTTHYEFQGTFDGSPISFSSPVTANSGNTMSGAVFTWGNNPSDPAKQNKQLCISLRAVNAGGVSSYSSNVCSSYRYYTLSTSTQLNFQQVNISR
jgi:hypothetical protein